MYFRFFPVLVFSMFAQTFVFAAAPQRQTFTLVSRIGQCSSINDDCGEVVERLQAEVITTAWKKCHPLPANRVSAFNVQS